MSCKLSFKCQHLFFKLLQFIGFILFKCSKGEKTRNKKTNFCERKTLEDSGGL